MSPVASLVAVHEELDRVFARFRELVLIGDGARWRAQVSNARPPAASGPAHGSLVSRLMRTVAAPSHCGGSSRSKR